ncbi:MAG: ABC transporter ATP-binding protein [Roseiflexaceae bacterium]|nr:ABC transporter ATP-binding protein [Roseiflexaceae bacterium]
MQLRMNTISKQYRQGFWGLREVSLELGPGILGLLGPNGAGKSTLMRILATITKPSSGTATWGGVDIAAQPNALRNVLGYLPQDFGVYPHLNAIEFLEYMAAIKGIEARTARRRIDELLVLTNLHDAAKRPLGGYSGGMRQRVGIAQALLNDPKLLIVDEPTVGLDPEERVRFRNLLTDLSGERIIILSTHIVSDIEATATEVALMNKGRMLLHATPDQIVRTAQGQVWEFLIPPEELTSVKRQVLITSTVRRSDGIFVRAVAPNAPHTNARAVEPTLEDAYLLLVERDRTSTEHTNASGRMLAAQAG